jgi:hypothetical protein
VIAEVVANPTQKDLPQPDDFCSAAQQDTHMTFANAFTKTLTVQSRSPEGLDPMLHTLEKSGSAVRPSDGSRRRTASGLLTLTYLTSIEYVQFCLVSLLASLRTFSEPFKEVKSQHPMFVLFCIVLWVGIWTVDRRSHLERKSWCWQTRGGVE